MAVKPDFRKPAPEGGGGADRHRFRYRQWDGGFRRRLPDDGCGEPLPYLDRRRPDLGRVAAAKLRGDGKFVQPVVYKATVGQAGTGAPGEGGGGMGDGDV